MSSKEDSIRSQSGAKPPTSKQGPSAPTSVEELPAAKPPILWMMVPLVLIGLALYFAR
jgi:hypothetical protein